VATVEARYAARLRVALLRSIARAVAVVEAGGTAELAAARVSSTEVAAVLTALYVEAGTAAARRQYATLTAAKAQAPPAVLLSWAQRLQGFIRTEGAAAVRGITETTRAQVRRILAQAAASGEGVAAAARALRNEVAALARARSLAIARTELVSSASLGSLLGAQATGLKLEKVWISAKDGRVRPTHASANGQGAPLQDGMFVVGGYRCRYPGDPMLPARERVNCRCTVGYRKPA
jgi:uncharacterized protein with gpF-like domain